MLFRPGRANREEHAWVNLLIGRGSGQAPHAALNVIANNCRVLPIT